ncbi:pyridoxamine 5'-phosphate oxidase family protein [uncultured Nocardioides sp.]|uniref:pyridoxamine 5'-phosphate oxidase family protein n=1 Tax=uncultured Nocardioides sp. TaxID=198441 RepID=UPI0030FBC585
MVDSAAGVRLEELDEDTCWRLVASVPVGRIAWNETGGPVVVPVNHVVADGAVVVRTGAWSGLERHVDDSDVAYEVDHLDEETREGWSLLVRGPAEVTYDGAGTHPEPWAGGARPVTVRVRPRSVSGRRLVGGGEGDARSGG